MTTSIPRVVAAFVAAGWLVGLIEGWALARAPLAAVLASAPALLLGILAAAVIAIARRSTWLLRWRDSIESRDRRQVVRTHALVLSAVALVALASWLASRVHPALSALQIEALAHKLAVVATVLLVAGALLAVAPLAKLLERFLAKVDARFPLPLPRWPAARALVFVTLPAFALLHPFVREHAASLGWVRDVILLVLVTVAALPLLWLFRSLRSAPLVPLVGVALLAVAVHPRLAKGAAAAENTLFGSLGARLLRSASDFDRDGASPLLGGNDCAPFDASRSPTRAEVYDNGIDEDCSGGDDSPPPAAVAGRPKLFADAFPEASRRKYNVVWIVVDSLRADRLSLYGHPKPTTPNIDELAKESLVFTRALSQSSATAVSFPSMLSGRNPGELSWQADEEPIPQVALSETLAAERLKSLGYETGAVLSSYTLIDTPHVRQGLDKAFEAGKTSTGRSAWTRLSPIVTSRAIEWIAEHVTAERPRAPFFLTLFYPDPHGAYIRHRDLTNDAHFGFDDEASYEAEVAFVDQHLRVLLEALKARPLVWRDTIVVITSDHGEEFREHGNVSHGTTCHIESVHVPLVVRIPGVEPKRIDTPVALVDIVPTLLDLVGERTNVDRLSGQSLLVPAFEPAAIWPSRPIFCAVTSQRDAPGVFVRRAVRRNGFALMHDLQRGRTSLFDTEADPGEHHDLFDLGKHAAQIEALERLLRQSNTPSPEPPTRSTHTTSG